jgi:transposase-like protein
MKKFMITISAVALLTLTACSSQAVETDAMDAMKSALVKVEAQTKIAQVEKAISETVKQFKAQKLEEAFNKLKAESTVEKVQQSLSKMQKEKQLEAIEALVDSFNTAV